MPSRDGPCVHPAQGASTPGSSVVGNRMDARPIPTEGGREPDGRKAHPISVKRRRVELREEVARAGSQGDRQGRPYKDTRRDGTGPCSGTGDPGGRPAGRLSACHHHHTLTPMGWTQGPSLLNFAIDDLAAQDGRLHAVLWHLFLIRLENVVAQHNGIAKL